MLWSSAKVESKELTGEPEPTQCPTSGQSAETGSRKSQVLLTNISKYLSLLELAKGFEPPTC
jgi:hypothetical protein